MSDALIASLNDNLAKANKEAANRRHIAKGLKAERDRLAKERADLIAERDTLLKERDGLKQAAEAAPGEKDNQIKDLQGRLWTVTHKDVFRTKAIAKGAKPEAIDDLYALSGYKAEGERVDEAKIDGLVGTLATSKPYAFAGQAPTDKTTAKPDLPPGPGANRGEPAKSGGSYSVRRSDAQDPAWMAANQVQLSKAVNEGTLVWTD